MKKRPRPRDANLLALDIVRQATEEPAPEPVAATPEEKPAKNAAAAVELGRLGGLKGGKARAAALERRREIAQKAAAARWADKAESRA